MNITRHMAVAIASLSLGGALSTTFVLAQSAHVVVPANKGQWGPAPPALPAGAEIAVLEGNPSEKGAVTLRLRFPANYNIPAHWHSMATIGTPVVPLRSSGCAAGCRHCTRSKATGKHSPRSAPISSSTRTMPARSSSRG